MQNEQNDFDHIMSMVDTIKNDPQMDEFVKEHMDPKNGFVSQEYANWLNSKEYYHLHAMGVHLNVNEHTLASPSEIIKEFEDCMKQINEDFENGTLEEVDLAKLD